MTLAKSTNEILNVPLLGKGAMTSLNDCTAVDLTEAAEFALECRATFAASASADLRVHLRASSDGTNYDTVDVGADEDGYFDLNYVPGSTEQKTVPVYTDFKYLKVLVENLDSNYSAVNVTVDSIVQEVSST